MIKGKSDFLNFYYSGPKPKLTIHFDSEKLLADGGITLAQKTLPCSEIENFYVLRAVKDSKFDKRGIEERENDPGSNLITLTEARKDPGKWDLSRNEILPKHLWPIPIAQDILSGKSLILDSNHLLVDSNFYLKKFQSLLSADQIWNGSFETFVYSIANNFCGS